MGFFDWVDSVLPSNPFADGGTPDTSGGSLSSSGGDFGPGISTPAAGNNIVFAGGPQQVKVTPVAPNSSFTTGLNLLFSNPSAFINTLFSDNADSVPNADVQRAATTPLKDNLPTIPTWVKLTLIGGVAVLGLGVIAITLHEVRKI